MARIVTILRMNFLIIIVLAVGLVIITPWVLPLLFGKIFIPATVTTQILIVGAFVLGMNHVLTQGMLGIKRPGVPAFAQGLSLGVMLILLYALLPIYGILGAAIASLITYAIIFTTLLFYLIKQSGFGFIVFLPKISDCKILMSALSSIIRKSILAIMRK